MEIKLIDITPDFSTFKKWEKWSKKNSGKTVAPNPSLVNNEITEIEPSGRLKLTKVKFLTTYDVCSDEVARFSNFKNFYVLKDGGSYYHWLPKKDEKGKRKRKSVDVGKPAAIPITFASTDFIELEATFEVVSDEDFKDIPKVKVTHNTKKYTFNTILDGKKSEEFTLKFKSDNKPFENTVEYIKTFTLNFEYSDDGKKTDDKSKTWHPAGSSVNTLYVTWKEPEWEVFMDTDKGNQQTTMQVRCNKNGKKPNILESLLWLGCKEAIGKGYTHRVNAHLTQAEADIENEEEILDAIFKQFKDLQVWRCRDEEEVNKQHPVLENEKALINNKVDTIEKEFLQLKADFDSIEKKLLKLQADIDSISIKIGPLLITKTALESAESPDPQKITAKQNEIDKLEKDKTQLEKDKTQSEKDKTQLESETQTKEKEFKAEKDKLNAKTEELNKLYMGYWRGVSQAIPQSAYQHKLRFLLSNKEARCVQWAHLFRHIALSQGIILEQISIRANRKEDYSPAYVQNRFCSYLFLVKGWDIDNVNETAPIQRPSKTNLAQGNNRPFHLFWDHIFVGHKKGSDIKYYDPSYGVKGNVYNSEEGLLQAYSLAYLEGVVFAKPVNKSGFEFKDHLHSNSTISPHQKYRVPSTDRKKFRYKVFKTSVYDSLILHRRGFASGKPDSIFIYDSKFEFDNGRLTKKFVIPLP